MNGQSASSSQPGPSSSSPVSGDQFSQTQLQQSALPDGQHSAVICEHLWKNGWQQGLYSDVEVRVRNRPYKLHRIILSKSPYMVYLLNMTPYGHPIWIPVPDDPMYDEAVAIVLGYLYASHMYNEVNASNARSVLAVATVFGIPDLGSYAYEVCRQSINADNILDWVDWIELQAPKSTDHASTSSSRASTPQSAPGDGQFPNGSGVAHANSGGEGMSFGTAPTTSHPVSSGQTQNSSGTQNKREATGQSRSSNGWQDVLSQPATSYVAQLRQDIYTYLTVRLPEELQQNDQHITLNDNPAFNEIFVRLPFDLFKACIEDSHMKLGTDQERFAFAKSAIQQRKKRGAVRNAQGQSETPSVVENVVLRFGGGSGSKVHITRKSKQRALWKVDKE